MGRAERSEEVSGEKKLEWEVRGIGVRTVQVQCFAHPHLNIFLRLSPMVFLAKDRWERS